MQLNVKDKKILSELDLNARATFQEIAKTARLSKESVIYRVKLLEKKGIIQRYTTLVNFTALGYTGYVVYSRFQNVNEELKKEIISYLENIPEIYWIALVGGKFDIAFGIMAKNVFQFNKIYYAILSKYGSYLADNAIAIRTELRQHKRDYLSEKKPKALNAPFFGKEPEILELDLLDSNILTIMSNNARISLVELAAMLEKPASTVSLRIRQMGKSGIIQGYSAYIRPQKYGMQSYRLLINLQNMNEKSRSQLFSYINTNPKMLLAIETVGEWGFEITLEVESHEELQKEISMLRGSMKDIIKGIEFLIMFEDDLVYDPYPLKKLERGKFLNRAASERD
jgi:DNA-binding Lrp family transcriptional regulator